MEDIVVTVLDTDYIPEYEEKEEERRNNEEARVISENERIQSENTRIANEEVRQTNETNRIAQYNLIQSKLNNGDFNGEDGYSPTVITSKVDRTTTITITDKNGEHTATILDGEDGSGSSGGMKKEVYDTNDNGIVDNAEKVNNHTVQTDVPANAVFTDTVFSGDYNDLSNKPNIPTKTSDLTNDTGYISSYTETDPTVPSHVKGISQSDITNWNNKSTFSGNYEDLTNKPTIPTVPTNVSSFTNDAGYLTSHQDISGKQDIIQYSIMPTASISNLGDIIQYTGTTDSNYTNGYFYKCVSDGQEPATYSWEEVEVQASSGGSSYTAGTNIEITSGNVINNTIPYESTSGNGFVVGQKKANTTINTTAVGIGKNITASGLQSVAIGHEAQATDQMTVAIGQYSKATGSYSIVIGRGAEIYSASNSITIGAGAIGATNGITIGSESRGAVNVCQLGSNRNNINKINIYTSTGNKEIATQEFVQNYLTTVNGYDSTKTQVLKNVNGTLTWVDE